MRNPPIPPRGVSLIELLVAVAIIAALYGAIVVAVDAVGGARSLEREGQRFAGLVELACERAEITGRDHGIHVSRDRYGFSTATLDGWRLETAGDLRPRELPSGFVLAFEREGTEAELEEENTDAPQAACFASGELTPFVATISTAELAPYEIEGAIDGAVETRVREAGP